MGTPRKIKDVLPAFKVNMGGIMLDQALPHRKVDQVDPFLLVHHLRNTIPAGTLQKDAGVPPHPHRGFAPVTFVFEGGVHHRDSMQKSSVIYAGGTQWMSAGKGIVHSERPAKEVALAGDAWELIQFWVNVPAKYKMDDPAYIPLTAETTPTIQSEDGKFNIGVITGELEGVKGPVMAKSDMLILRLTIQTGGRRTIAIPEGFNAFTYQVDGRIILNDSRQAKPKDLVLFENSGDEITIEAVENTRMILLAGQPIDEPVATYGPFVMNTQQEIMEAIQDYQAGKMGVLEEQFD